MTAPLREAKDSLAKASTPEPFSTSKTSNWVARAGGLPPYVQHIAHDLMEKRGKSESNAIQMALGIVKNWCSGQGKVDKNTRAAACKAVAEWEAKKAKNKAKSVSESFSDLLEALADEVEAARHRLALNEGLQATLEGGSLREHDRACRSTAALLGEAPRDRWHALELLREAALWDRIALIDAEPKRRASIDELAEARKKADGDGSDGEGSGEDDSDYKAYFAKLKKRGMNDKQAAALARQMCKRKNAKEADSSGDLSTASRNAAADKGYALDDGSFPIRNVGELRKAIRAFGRAKDKKAARAHIIRRARDLKATNILPPGWGAKLSEGAPGGRAEDAPFGGPDTGLDLSEFLGHFDEAKHRRLHGKFAAKLGGLAPGSTVALGHGIHVQAPHGIGQPYVVSLHHQGIDGHHEMTLARDADHAATIAVHARRHRSLHGVGQTLREAFDFRAALHPRDRAGKFRDVPTLPKLDDAMAMTRGLSTVNSPGRPAVSVRGRSRDALDPMRGGTSDRYGNRIPSVTRPKNDLPKRVDSPALGAQHEPHSPGRPGPEWRTVQGRRVRAVDATSLTDAEKRARDELHAEDRKWRDSTGYDRTGASMGSLVEDDKGARHEVRPLGNGKLMFAQLTPTEAQSPGRPGPTAKRKGLGPKAQAARTRDLRGRLQRVEDALAGGNYTAPQDVAHWTAYRDKLRAQLRERT